MLTEDDVIDISSDSISTLSLSSEESESSEELTDQVLVERIERVYNNMLPQLSYEEVRDYFNARLTEDDVIDISSDSSSTLSSDTMEDSESLSIDSSEELTDEILEI